MKTEDVLKVMDHIDPALTQELDLAPRKKRRLSAPLRAGLAAACVCLVLLGSALAVDAIWGVRIADFVGQGERTGFQVFADTARRVPLDSLPQAVLDLPRGELMTFDSEAEAEQVLDMSLPGFAPFQGLDRARMNFAIGPEGSEMETLSEEDMTFYHTYCYLRKFGPNADGSDPNGICVAAQYVRNTVTWRGGGAQPDQQVIFFHVTANVITEVMPYDAFGGIGSSDGSIRMEQSSFVTADGQGVPVIRANSPLKVIDDAGETESNLAMVWAYYVQEGVIYQVCVHGWAMENGQRVDMTTEVLQAALEEVLTAAGPAEGVSPG